MNKTIPIVIVALLAAFAALGLAAPLGQLDNATVSVNATGDPEELTSGTPLPSSVCVQNTSATCVHVGGSAVTTTTGIAVGDGCAAGMVFCFDGRRAYAESASGSIDVEVVYGSN